MTGISTYASNGLLNYLFKRQTFPIPTVWWLGVSTTPLGHDGIGATEPIDVAYKRIAIPNNKISFSVASNKIISIVQEFIFPISTVSWGSCTHYMIYDNNIGGNIWFYGNLQEPRDVEIETSLILDPNVNQIAFEIFNDLLGDGIDVGSTSDMAITTYMSNAIGNHVFGQSPFYNPPSTYYLGASSTALDTNGIGATEPGGNYSRLAMPNDLSSFANADSKSITTAKVFKFVSADTPWGNMTHFFIADSLTGGNILWCGKLKYSRNVQTSTVLTLRPSHMVFRLDNNNYDSFVITS